MRGAKGPSSARISSTPPPDLRPLVLKGRPRSSTAGKRPRSGSRITSRPSPKRNFRKTTALTGLASVARNRGALRGKRAIAGGQGALRPVLFLAARVASHHNPSRKAFAKSLRSVRKPHKVIATVVARKPCIIAKAQWKRAQIWQFYSRDIVHSEWQLHPANHDHSWRFAAAPDQRRLRGTPRSRILTG